MDNPQPRKVYRCMPLPSLPEDVLWRRERMQQFLYDWDHVPSLVQWSGGTMRERRPLDWYGALSYMYYEDLESMFAPDAQALNRLAALILGETLVAHAGFVWCRSTLFPDEALQVHNAFDDVLHLPALVQHARARRHMEVMEELLCDVLCHYCAGDWHTYHWLMAVSRLDWQENVHMQTFGVCPPRELRKRIRLLSAQDAEYCLRLLGVDNLLPAWDFQQHPDWQEIEWILKTAERQFCEQYGKDWQAEALRGICEHVIDHEAYFQA